jgi:cyclic-di-GMP phosphodiesterase TipF (flagellum assembly factor)
MTLIAASLGAVVYLLAGLSGLESAVVALAALTALAIYNGAATRLRDRSDFGGQIADLSRGTDDLARQLAELSRRTAALEEQRDKLAERATEKARAVTEPVTAELGELGGLVKQLAETVTLHELKLAKDFDVAGVSEEGPQPPHDAPSVAGPAAPERDAAPAAGVSDLSLGADDMTEVVREAIGANRIDLYLQPIVTLPQRKVRYYEAFTWLRNEDGALLQPSDFLGAAEAGGLLPQLDNLLLFRSVQVVRRLQLKNRDVGLFCNFSAATLNEPQLFADILQFMDANRALAPSLVLQFKQGALRSMGLIETEALSSLRELGFRFCMDQIADLRMDPRDLGERGIRYVKVPAPLLLGQAGAPTADIHAADLSDLLGRFGISLIADRIEAEAQVVDLLEYDVRFGQGLLFSPPRPVRAEALHGAGRAAETQARDGIDKPRDQASADGPAGVAL